MVTNLSSKKLIEVARFAADELVRAAEKLSPVRLHLVQVGLRLDQALARAVQVEDAGSQYAALQESIEAARRELTPCLSPSVGMFGKEHAEGLGEVREIADALISLEATARTGRGRAEG
jgi:hypothetical protein